MLVFRVAVSEFVAGARKEGFVSFCSVRVPVAVPAAVQHLRQDLIFILIRIHVLMLLLIHIRTLRLILVLVSFM